MEGWNIGIINGCYPFSQNPLVQYSIIPVFHRMNCRYRQAGKAHNQIGLVVRCLVDLIHQVDNLLVSLELR